MGLFYRIWDGIRQVIGLVLPVFSRARDLGRIGQGVRTVLHIVLLVLIVGVLWFLNQWPRLELYNLVSSPTFNKIWLPVLFLLIYGLSWLGWVLWKLLLPEEESSDFPDIDEAWDEAVDTLERAGVSITEVPLFLILGKPAAGEEAMFQAAGLARAVFAPKQGDAPLHVLGNSEAVYITCPGASLLGAQAGILQEKGRPGPGGGGGMDEPGVLGDVQDAMNKTATPEAMVQIMQNILGQAEREGRSVTQLKEEEKLGLRVAQVLDEAAYAQQQVRPRRSLLKEEKERALELTERLKHLCSLIVRDRRPYCPVNGMLIALPFASMDTEEDAAETAAILQQDLAACREVLQMNWPTLMLVCDLEQAPGFREFCDSLPSQVKQQRLGQRFPHVPSEPSEVPAQLVSLAEYVCQGSLPKLIWPLFRVEGTPEKLKDMVRINSQLYRLLDQLRERHRRLGRILSQGIGTSPDGELPLLGGCYLGATGRDATHEQAFVPGVFRRLVEDQAFVSWTDAALEEEGDFQRWTRMGYTALGIGAAVLIAAGAWLLMKGK